VMEAIHIFNTCSKSHYSSSAKYHSVLSPQLTKWIS